jgi:predicted amidophosphoribosyltransferase
MVNAFIDHNIPMCSNCKCDVDEIDDEGYCVECSHEFELGRYENEQYNQND